MITPVSEVIPEKNVIILSPHYDDVPLTFGGYLDALVANKLISGKNIRIINIFSRSNYLSFDDEGNKDISLKRIQHVMGIRILEDLNCLDDLIGHDNYNYEIKAEPECLVREKKLVSDGVFEFLPGERDSFDENDWKAYNRIRKYASEWLTLEDTAVLLPMGMKEHVDHVILREAVIDAKNELGQDASSTVYIGEDLPYTGLADTNDWNKINVFFSGLAIRHINYSIDEYRKIKLIMKHYPTQFEDSYKEGVLKRAAQLKQKYGADTGVERLYHIE
jgi:hypothetical protein